jgi:hypothetical protein
MMGYPMALNVRRKLPKSSSLHIYDLSKSALERFVEEVGSEGDVIVATSAKEVVDNAVISLHEHQLIRNRTRSSRCCRRDLTSNQCSLLLDLAVSPQPPNQGNFSSILAPLTQLLPLKSATQSQSQVLAISPIAQSLYPHQSQSNLTSREVYKAPNSAP